MQLKERIRQKKLDLSKKLDSLFSKKALEFNMKVHRYKQAVLEYRQRELQSSVK
jgi:hypothetical protein